MTPNQFMPLFLISLLISATSQAAELACTGKDPTGEPMEVKLDLEKNTMIVNGEDNVISKPDDKEAKDVIGVTEAYATREYGNVYITLVKKSDTEFTINQVKAKNREVMSTVNLTCKPK